jgi:hypothetical protein
MTINKSIGIFIATLFSSFSGIAQIPMTSIVEHFTNTSCSVCASNNGSIHTAINNHPGVLHISFHPSSPYSNDFFNQQNMVENDARTQFYGLFGGTPQIALNGIDIPSNTLNTALNNNSSLTSNYQFNILQTQITVDSFSIRAVITKIAIDNNTTALLFLGAYEDTINQTTNNGEPTHYNVFRKTITSVTGDLIALPINVGDTLVNNYGYRKGSAWNVNRMHTIGILQKTTKEVLNSAKSNDVINIVSGTDNNFTLDGKNIFYPNPVTSNKLYLKTDIEELAIYSLIGEKLFYEKNLKNTESISLNSLQPGVYIVRATNGKNISNQKIIKQ